MNVKNELIKIEGIKNIVCRDNGTLEVYSNKNVQNSVINFLHKNSLQWSFAKIDFHDMSKWID